MNVYKSFYDFYFLEFLLYLYSHQHQLKSLIYNFINKVMIIYTDHLKTRLRLRNIPEEYPGIILENPEQRFFDVLEKRNVSIKKDLNIIKN